MPRERASRAWVFYQHRNYVDSFTDADSYRSQSIFADLESETDDLYGEASIRRVYAPWLTSGALADTTASKILTRFVDVPSQVSLQMDAKDRDYWVGDTVTISHFLDVDEFGVRRLRNWKTQRYMVGFTTFRPAARATTARAFLTTLTVSLAMRAGFCLTERMRRGLHDDISDNTQQGH